MITLVKPTIATWAFFGLLFSLITLFTGSSRGVTYSIVFAGVVTLAGAYRILLVSYAWRKVADAMGIQYTPSTSMLALISSGFGEVAGTYRDRTVRLRGISRTTGVKNRRTSYHPLLQAAVDLPPETEVGLGQQLTFSGFGLMGGMVKRLAGEVAGTPLGDAAWDAEWWAQSDPPELIQQALRSLELRAKLMALNPVIIKLEEGMLNLTEQSSAKRKPEYLQRCLDTLCDLAEALEAAQRMEKTTAGRRRRSR